MPWFPWLKKKETPEQKNAREEREALAKGLVKNYHLEWDIGQHSMPEEYQVTNWVTPKVAEQRKKERLQQAAAAKAEYNLSQKKRREAEAAEERRLREKKIADCRAFIRQVEAEDKKKPRLGGKRFTTRRNRKSKRNTRTMKHL